MYYYMKKSELRRTNPTFLIFYYLNCNFMYNFIPMTLSSH